MRSRLGVYFSVEHRRPQDYAYFRALDPTVFKIMDGGPPDYLFVRESLPGALVIARDWALSEQHADMLYHPEETGIRHAREWNMHQARLGFDRANTLILGINEPTVWEPNVPEALRLYTIALCREATTMGLRVGAMQLGVGWPGNNGEGTPPDWAPFHGVEEAILANGGALVCHEYWADQGPNELWGWWAGRTLKCPWQVPIIIGECGVDMFVKNTSVGQQHRGWIGHMPPERYAAELREYTARMSADPRFVGNCVFASDFQSHEWYSFDVEPAYQAILAIPAPPFELHLPSVGTGQKTAYVAVPSGANLRDAPSVQNSTVLIAVPRGDAVGVLGWDDNGQWANVTYQDKVGWMLGSLIVYRPPAPLLPTDPNAPGPPAQNSECWDRSLAFVRKWEGGWADDPNDPGGATNKGITYGTFAKWRADHGQPSPSKEDLKALTDGEANQIYRERYWGKAKDLEWPLCLAYFDTAVNSGTGNADQILAKSGGNFIAFMGHLIEWYASIDGFDHYGRAWMKRRADLLKEGAK